MKKRIGINLGILLMSWVGICQAGDTLERARQLIAEGKERNNIVQLREAVSLLQAGGKAVNLHLSLSLASYIPMGVMTPEMVRRPSH
ncbi:hypothetical protein [Aeromonas dhakensis]|uniref:hypothetical protein n=1 Tax=Aeromonas dhakensis TaxID=196024 RepID=UPI003BA0E4DB